MPLSSQNRSTTIEAKVTSKGQVTLPKELRKRLGIQNGSRIRFNIPASGPVQVERVLYDLEDLWQMADEGVNPGPVMSLEEMNEAKARRHW
jgi:antitoxin PrlF